VLEIENLPGRISELKLRPDFIFSVLKNKILNKISTVISAVFLHRKIIADAAIF